MTLRCFPEKYAGWLRAHELQDANNLLDFAATSLRAQRTIHDSRFTIHSLWLDGFAEMTPQEMDLLAAVIPVCDRAVLAFCLDESGAKDGENSWLSIWAAVDKASNNAASALKPCRIAKSALKISNAARAKVVSRKARP